MPRPRILPTALACSAHKSLEIFERCRLRQRHSPAEPKNGVALLHKEFETVCFWSIYFNSALKQPRKLSGLIKSFLALTNAFGFVTWSRNWNRNFRAHIVAAQERQAKTDAGLVPVCPFSSMVPVLWR
jgi:hypothetical protein